MPNLTLLRQVFASIYTSDLSDAFRRWYAQKKFIPDEQFPTSHDEWIALPFTEKKDLASLPFYKRVYTDISAIDCLRASSGTSGGSIVLMARKSAVDRSAFVGRTTRFLGLHLPHCGYGESFRACGISYIGGDPQHPDANARLAATLAIDGIGSAIMPLLTFTPHLAKRYETEQIRLIHLFGERPSRQQWNALRHAYPSAQITWEYSSSETNGPAGLPCPSLEKLYDNHVHPVDDFMWELIDSSGSVIEGSGEGELVLTTLSVNLPSPLIRYRTGDTVARVPTTCACGKATYQIQGRVQFDRAFIGGGEIRSTELERVIALHALDIAHTFELHYFAAQNPPALILYIEPLRTLDFQTLAHDIAAHLRVAPSTTLADAIASTRCPPLRIARFPEPPTGKIRRIVVHNTQ